MIDRSGQHIGDRLDPAVGMPRKAAQVIVGLLTAKVVEQQERVHALGVAKAETAVQVDEIGRAHV